MLSTVINTSVAAVVVGIENRARNDATGPLYLQNTLVSTLDSYVINCGGCAKPSIDTAERLNVICLSL